jgi:hypothetical protein
VAGSPSGRELLVSVTVIGPLTVEGGCVASLSATVETSAGQPVPAQAAVPSPLIHCLAIAVIGIPAGVSSTFTVSVPAPERPRSYVVVPSLRIISGAASNTVPSVSIST